MKDQVTVLKTGAETDGKYVLLEVELAPGGASPLHYHSSFSEEYSPVEGMLGLTIGKKKYDTATRHKGPGIYWRNAPVL